MKRMADNIHKGHRDRLKKEFLNGFFGDSTPDHKWLELLLFYCIPQRDTNPLAHELIKKFGSISGVLNAPVEELIKFNGLTENTVVLLKLITPIMRKCELESIAELNPHATSDYIGNIAMKQFYGLQKERLGVFLLGATGKLLGFKFLGEGDLEQVGISIRKIVKYALDNDAQSVILAHNHPGYYALPSDIDLEATANLFKTLGKLNIRLIDHLIVSGKDYVSLAQTPKYQYIFK